MFFFLVCFVFFYVFSFVVFFCIFFFVFCFFVYFTLVPILFPPGSRYVLEGMSLYSLVGYQREKEKKKNFFFVQFVSLQYCLFDILKFEGEKKKKRKKEAVTHPGVIFGSLCSAFWFAFRRK